MIWKRAYIGQLDTVRRTACIAHSPLLCKRSNEMIWKRAYIGQLDTVHGTACIAHSPLVCKRGLHCSIGPGAQNGLHSAFTVGVQEAHLQPISSLLLQTNGKCAMQAVPCTMSNCPM